eukprot:c9701_g1_i3.p1 GENE.c9701_g1_i3~~c9701_g1_i3.p1  ORF type:complete len:622 (+),score=170.41 c9701_g1_i3:478-2343(+)
MLVGLNTVCKMLDVPISLRHVKDARAESIRQQLILTVTPRLLDLALEATSVKVDESTTIQEDDFRLHLPWLLEHLSDLCELQECAEIVCNRNMAINTLLSVLVKMTTTAMDQLQTVSGLTDTSGGWHAGAVQQLLRFLSITSNHLKTSEAVAHGMFRSDPMVTLVRVIQTRAPDESQQLAAYTIFKLAESSMEHRETAERVQAIPALLQLLKTGSYASQSRASFALECLLEDSEPRQSQFRESGGARPLVRLLERESGDFAVSLQTMVVHLSSLRQSAIALVEAGVVVVLVGLLETRDPPTMGRAASALLRLAYHQDLRKQLNELNVPSALETALTASTKPIPQQTWTNRNVQYDTEARARWVLEDVVPQARFWLLDLDKPRTKKAAHQHVMLSYNWAHQKEMLRIKQGLEKRGFLVWIDTEKMLGNLLTKMAEAVEDSFVVLMGFSSKYQQSDNCRSEAEYARHLKKPTIPCIMEKGFQASGWLGLILGEKLYYDFSQQDSFEVTLENVVREIQAIQKGQPQQSAPKYASSSPATVVQSAPVSVTPAPATSAQPAQGGALPTGKLGELLKAQGLLQDVGPLLVQQGVDSIELLKDFTAEELAAMGVKWGPAKKLLKALGK